MAAAQIVTFGARLDPTQLKRGVAESKHVRRTAS